MLHTKYQVVYPFPTFQPAFQLKKDQVVLLNTSYSLVACAVSVHSAGGFLGLPTGPANALLVSGPCDPVTWPSSPLRSAPSLPRITDEVMETPER